jgi:molybdopterin molybdotransferase
VTTVPRSVDFDDCFRSGDEHHTLAGALAQFDTRLATIVGTERIAARDAQGRILAEDVIAGGDIPPHDNSAMDGYAVYFDDLSPSEATILLRGPRIAAGHPYREPIPRGFAAQIFTGAAMPIGPDTVVMAEDAAEKGGQIVIHPGIKRGAHIRRAGEDDKRGGVVLRPRLRLRPQDIGMLASLGKTDIAVHRRLRVAVFSAGDEVHEPGGALAPGGIFDANRYTLMALLERLGCSVTDLGILPDQTIAIRASIAAAAEGHDLLLTSGGVSYGGEDRVREAMSELGSVHFWSLATKPGRIVALGHVAADARAVPFIGLPGNPVAVVVMFLMVARPILLRFAGAESVKPVAFRVPAGFDFVKKAGRREWLRARLIQSQNGPVAQKFSEDGSGILSSMVETDGLIELAEDVTGVARGDMVDFLPYTELMG